MEDEEEEGACIGLRDGERGTENQKTSSKRIVPNLLHLSRTFLGNEDIDVVYQAMNFQEEEEEDGLSIQQNEDQTEKSRTDKERKDMVQLDWPLIVNLMFFEMNSKERKKKTKLQLWELARHEKRKKRMKKRIQDSVDQKMNITRTFPLSSFLFEFPERTGYFSVSVELAEDKRGAFLAQRTLISISLSSMHSVCVPSCCAVVASFAARRASRSCSLSSFHFRMPAT